MVEKNISGGIPRMKCTSSARKVRMTWMAHWNQCVFFKTENNRIYVCGLMNNNKVVYVIDARIQQQQQQQQHPTEKEEEGRKKEGRQEQCGGRVF